MVDRDNRGISAAAMPELIPGPAYLIRTHRLVIRCWNPSDASLLKTAVDESLEHLKPWMPFVPENLRSSAIPRKLGFELEATLRRRLPIMPDSPLLRDMEIWTLMKEEFPGSPSSQIEIEAFDAIGRKII